MQAAGKRYIWHGSAKDVFSIWNLSDLHWMSKSCDESQIRADIETIRNDPFAFWLGGGDYCEFIGYSDRRFDPDAVAESVSVADLGNVGKADMEAIRDLFRPIRDKSFGLLLGNHEKKYELVREHAGLHSWLCQELRVPDLGYCALFDVVFCRTAGLTSPRLERGPAPRARSTSRSFRIFAHHGAGYAQTPGGKLNRLVQFMQSFDADLYFVGHVHDRVARREPAIGADSKCTSLEKRDRLGLVSGSYLKTYEQGTTSYGEMKGYRPTALGAAIAKVVPHTGHMEAAV